MKAKVTVKNHDNQASVEYYDMAAVAGVYRFEKYNTGAGEGHFVVSLGDWSETALYVSPRGDVEALQRAAHCNDRFVKLDLELELVFNRKG